MNAPRGTAPIEVVIPRALGNVRLGEELGRGSGGVVFSGHDVMLDRRVAVKVLSQTPGGGGEADLSRFIEGVRSAAAVKHENILTVYSVDSVEGRPLIVMEHVDGMSLRALLRRGGGLQALLAVYVIEQIADAVAALHDAHIIHRDLKPANVLIDRDGGTHVCDFGLACRTADATPIGSGEGISGTPLYMAPEMFDGTVSTQSDVYALGAMLFEILAGRPPFSAETMDEMKSRHVREPLPVERLSASGADETLTEIVERAMHKNRILRYKTARHFLRAVQQAPLGERRPLPQRQRLAAMVVGGAEARAAEAQPTEPPAQTVAELVAKRAQAKRKGMDGSA
jgi:serine/threonine-protein kinase